MSNNYIIGKSNVPFGDASERTKKQKTSALMCMSHLRIYLAKSKFLLCQGHFSQAKTIVNYQLLLFSLRS